MKYAMATFCLALAASAPVDAQLQMHTPEAMSADQVSRASAGDSLQFAARVDSIDRSILHAHVLNKIGEETYADSGKTIDIYEPRTISFIMGKRDDVKPGAVLFIFAVATKPHQADATKIVIDTPYVTLK
jgi:hypothetical protein